VLSDYELQVLQDLETEFTNPPMRARPTGWQKCAAILAALLFVTGACLAGVLAGVAAAVAIACVGGIAAGLVVGRWFVQRQARRRLTWNR
jgi:Flp pilus assembly protein TadB